MRRFTRTPYFKGPDDPERKEMRGTLQLGETVVVETVGGHDQDWAPSPTRGRGTRPAA